MLMVKGMKKTIINSIIITTKNRVEHLERCLYSLNASGYFERPTVEILVVDNSLGDFEVETICRKWGARYVNEPRAGKSAAQNLGIMKSLGSVLTFTDDDVIINDHNWINKINEKLNRHQNLGYLSGNVIAMEKTSLAQKMWEKKGGLSKGTQSIYLINADIINSKNVWPLTKFCAGANCTILKKVFEQIGGYCELLGPGAMIGHGESIEIGYRIIRAGFDVAYDKDIVVTHNHPSDVISIKRKLFLYGVGDTALYFHLFLSFRDTKCLYWSLIGHPLYSLNKIIKRVNGKYSLPIDYVLYSIAGSLSGSWVYLYRRIKLKLLSKNHIGVA